MPKQSLWKLILIAVVAASGLCSCCTAKRHLAAYGIGPDASMDVDPPIDGDWTHRMALSDPECD
jgi:hypothetical protein